MEKIEYREVTFDVIRTLSCERTRMRDAANNYLHTHWDFTVEAHFQPSLTAYKQGPVSFPQCSQAVEDNPGGLPGQTDLAILNRILQPRGLLRVTAGDSIILETPQSFSQNFLDNGRAPCDVRGGPSCELVGAPVMIGLRHWVVTLRFVADVRDEDRGRSGDTQMVISNLWVCTEDIGPNHRSVRHFAGEATLRADIMRMAHLNANSFRDLYLFRQPNHYQRTNVQVHLSEDGTKLNWSFTDEMQGYDKGKYSPILKIEAFRTGYKRAGSPARVAAQAARTASVVGVNSPISTALGLTATPNAATLAGFDNIPSFYLSIRCDVTGDRNADLGRLTAVCLGVCRNQILGTGLGVGVFGAGLTEVLFRQDIADEVFTSVEMTQSWTADASVIRQFVAGGNVAGLPLAAQAAINAGDFLTPVFLQDSRQLTIPESDPDFADARRYLGGPGYGPPTNIVCSRDSTSSGLVTNLEMHQGAYGVIPDSQAVFRTNGTPIGTIPVGIEKLIVQALLGMASRRLRPRRRCSSLDSSGVATGS